MLGGRNIEKTGEDELPLKVRTQRGIDYAEETNELFSKFLDESLTLKSELTLSIARIIRNPQYTDHGHRFFAVLQRFEQEGFSTNIFHDRLAIYQDKCKDIPEEEYQKQLHLMIANHVGETVRGIQQKLITTGLLTTKDLEDRDSERISNQVIASMTPEHRERLSKIALEKRGIPDTIENIELISKLIEQGVELKDFKTISGLSKFRVLSFIKRNEIKIPNTHARAKWKLPRTTENAQKIIGFINEGLTLKQIRFQFPELQELNDGGYGVIKEFVKDIKEGKLADSNISIDEKRIEQNMQNAQIETRKANDRSINMADPKIRQEFIETYNSAKSVEEVARSFGVTGKVIDRLVEKYANELSLNLLEPKGVFDTYKSLPRFNEDMMRVRNADIKESEIRKIRNELTQMNERYNLPGRTYLFKLFEEWEKNVAEA
jgi:DNA-binding TFAR19-related protein (PDSD5 family)